MSKIYVINTNNFDFDVNTFETKADAFRFIERLMAADKYITKDKIVVVDGERIFLEIEEEVLVKVFEAESS